MTRFFFIVTVGLSTLQLAAAAIYYAASCAELRAKIPADELIDSDHYELDPDGPSSSGGHSNPVVVSCVFSNPSSQGITYVYPRTPNMFSAEKKHRCGQTDLTSPQDITIMYLPAGQNMSNIHLIMKNSTTCDQYVRYECNGSRLQFTEDVTAPPPTDSNVTSASNDTQQLAFWEDFNGIKRYYWGGSDDTASGCDCHKQGSATYPCEDAGSKCNCESGVAEWRWDAGVLRNAVRTMTRTVTRVNNVTVTDTTPAPQDTTSEGYNGTTETYVPDETFEPYVTEETVDEVEEYEETVFYLPVRRLFLPDIDSEAGKYANVKLGPLRCYNEASLPPDEVAQPCYIPPTTTTTTTTTIDPELLKWEYVDLLDMFKDTRVLIALGAGVGVFLLTCGIGCCVWANKSKLDT